MCYCTATDTIGFVTVVLPGEDNYYRVEWFGNTDLLVSSENDVTLKKLIEELEVKKRSLGL